jgi:HTH-type transcriptional repressor of NAD biosynthesis genes
MENSSSLELGDVTINIKSKNEKKIVVENGCCGTTTKLFKSIIYDLYCFTWWQSILLIIFCCASIVFSILDFNHFTTPDTDPNLLGWDNDRDNGITYWRRILMILSGVASFTGVMSVVLTTKGKFSSYFWGIINCILYGLFSFAYGYTGDAQLNIMFFLPFQFIGIYFWKDNLDDEETAIPKSLNFWKWLLVIIATIMLSFGFYYEIPPFTIALTGSYPFSDNPVPWKLDAISNALNVVAQVLLIGRYWEQWILWITVDCMQIAMYTGIAGFGISLNIIVMWCLFLINALFGIKIWFLRWYQKTNLSLFYSNFFNPDYEEKYPVGLIIGKFYPFHKGHMLLAETASKRCDKLFIIICEKENEQPSGELREQWIKKIIPKAIVKRILDIYNPDDSKIWAAVSMNIIECKPDVVFTSEDYGERFAEHLGCKHVLVDKERKAVKISGTVIRNKPLSYLKYLHPIVKAYYNKRVVLIGAESTGKTTLCQTLSEHLKTVWVPEYGRKVTEKKYKKGLNNIEPWTFDDFVDIAKEQCELENELAKIANKVLICDTNAFATIIWHYRYMESYSVEVENIYSKHKPADLYLLLDPTVPFVQDGEQYRFQMHDIFLKELQQRGLPYVVITGNYEERRRMAIKSIQSLIA